MLGGYISRGSRTPNERLHTMMLLLLVVTHSISMSTSTAMRGLGESWATVARQLLRLRMFLELDQRWRSVTAHGLEAETMPVTVPASYPPPRRHLASPPLQSLLHPTVLFTAWCFGSTLLSSLEVYPALAETAVSCLVHLI
jgi:hypothetical protein